MSVIWKRLQRVNKRASKYRILFELQELMVEGTTQWQPNKLTVVLSRRRRRVGSQPMSWEPTLRNPYRGLVVWSLPEILDIDVTLYRGMRSSRYEDKEWTISIEDIGSNGKPRRIASKNINISAHVDEQFATPSRQEFFKFQLNLTSKKVQEAYITFMMATQFLKEGKATDYDMESLTSMMSINATDGVQNLDDEDDVEIADHSAETSAQIFELANKFSELLQSNDVDPKDEEKKEEEEKKAKINSINESKVEYELENSNNLDTNNLESKHSNTSTSPTKLIPNGTIANLIPNLETSRKNDRTEPNRTAASSLENGVTHLLHTDKAKPVESSSSSSVTSIVPKSTASNNKPSSNKLSEVTSDENDRKLSKKTTPSSSSNPQSLVEERHNNHHNHHHHHSNINRTDNHHTNHQTELNRLQRVGKNRAESTISDNLIQDEVELRDVNNVDDQMPVYSTAEELLNWCRQVTNGYHGVKITNMTTSWRNGMAFCAIIHHHRPELIDFDSLKPSDVIGNCSKAFEAAFSLGIPKIIEANDMLALTIPDRLSVMTYLYQLKSYFAGQSTNNMIESNANNRLNNRYRYYQEVEEETEDEQQQQQNHTDDVKTRCMNLFNCLEELDNAAFMHRQNSNNLSESETNFNIQRDELKYIENQRNNNQNLSLIERSRNLTNQLSARTRNNNSDDVKLMTRKQLMNPFDSDSDEEIELIAKYDTKSNYSGASTPSVSSTDSDEQLKPKSGKQPREPIRKPLQFANSRNRNQGSSLPTSYSTISFPNYRSPSSSVMNNSMHSGLSKLAEPVEIAPGLLDLSSVRAYRLQRAFSAPTCHGLADSCRRKPEREEELRERARQLLESVRRERSTALNGASDTVSKDNETHINTAKIRDQDERQRILRERARKLIADAKQGIINGSSLDSPISASASSCATNSSGNTPMMSPSMEMSPQTNQSQSKDGLSLSDVSTINERFQNKSDFDKTKSTETNSSRPNSANNSSKSKIFEYNFYQFKQQLNSNSEINGNENHWQSESNANNRIESKNSNSHSKKQVSTNHEYSNYPDSFETIQEEIDFVEKEQKQNDFEAAILEKRLRKIMEIGGNKRLEEKLIQNWFVLVNQRNALIRRQMRLNILAKEEDMNRRYEELNQELRTLVSIDDSIKTNAQRLREKTLLENLVQIVDKRDELVRHLDNEEKAIEEDELVENATQGPLHLGDGQDDKNCVIQ